MTARKKLRIRFVLIIILALVVGLISYPNAVSKVPPVYNTINKLKINLGLDLQGGIHLEYKADLSQIDSSKADDAMQAVQDVIERRVNAFGVAEPTIYTVRNGNERKLVVELAGVSDINEAKNLIKETPFLEFRKENDQASNDDASQFFVPTGLTGKNLQSASVEFRNQGLSEPQVALKFDQEGKDLFAQITKENVGKRIAIYLDGQIISAPVVNEEILNGEAVINGNFSIQEANDLVKRLNEGALPVPINLVSQQSVESSLGQMSLEKSLKAGLIGLGLVIIFMILYYRFLGVVASVALLIYAGIMISIFKLSALTPWQITLTLPGIAGFVLSIGMAVDANILIFERTKEEIRKGRNILSAIDEGFKRAWTSIRDGNASSVITALILIEMGTGFVKGFAVTLILGVVVSVFTAVNISKILLQFLAGDWMKDRMWLIGVRKIDENILESKK